MRPDEAAALYLWAVGDGRRGIPDNPEEMARVGRGLQALIDIAGGHLLREPVDLGDGEESGIVKLSRPADVHFAMDTVEARAVWHAIATTVDLMDQVGEIPAEAPLFGQRDRLVAVAQRLDHEINHA